MDEKYLYAYNSIWCVHALSRSAPILCAVLWTRIHIAVPPLYASALRVCLRIYIWSASVCMQLDHSSTAIHRERYFQRGEIHMQTDTEFHSVDEPSNYKQLFWANYRLGKARALMTTVFWSTNKHPGSRNIPECVFVCVCVHIAHRMHLSVLRVVHRLPIYAIQLASKRATDDRHQPHDADVHWLR